MQTYCGAGTSTTMGSIPNPKIPLFPQFNQKGFNHLSFFDYSIHFSKPSRFSFVSNSLVTGRPPSSVSVPAPGTGGLPSSFLIFFMINYCY